MKATYFSTRQYIEETIQEDTRGLYPTTKKCPNCKTGILTLAKLQTRGYKKLCINQVKNPEGFVKNTPGCGYLDPKDILAIIPEA